jgi:4-amino-4-deoxy-L-arabinose transferase-like glycosyltransferase
VLISFALIKLALHIATNGQYGFHRDELQTLEDARHLAWGYVPYPPLTAFLGRIELELFGTSLRGFRFFAALAQSVAFVITGLMAKRFGAGRGAQLLAAVAAAIAPISLAASSLFQYVSFDYLWFVLMAYFVVCLIDSNDERWWVAIGAVIGLGVLTIYTVAFFVAGLVVGVFVTPLRAHLRGRWLWIGALLSVLIAAPNLWWQWQHDWITLDFLKHIHARDVRIGRTASFFKDQLFISSNAVTVPLWILGLVSLLRTRRMLAIMFVVPVVLFVIAQGRGYYTGPLYPMLLAAGAARLRSPRLMWLSMAIGGAAAAIVAMPITPMHSRAWEFASRVNGDLVEEVGWPELVAEVNRVYRTIPASERAGIFCANYGEAGAVDLYGPQYGLPHAISNINSYWLRGPGNPPPRTLVFVGGDREHLEERFDSVVLAGHTPNPYNVRNEETTEHPDIFICRGLKEPLEALWPKVRSFG